MVLFMKTKLKIDFTDLKEVLDDLIYKVEAKQKAAKPRQIIYIIEEHNGCRDDFEIVTFETTRDKAVETTKLLNEKFFECTQCGGRNRYSFREFQEGLGEGWDK